MTRHVCLLFATLLALSGCGPAPSDPPVDPVKAAAARRANMSITDPRIPSGFTIYSGNSGQVREFKILPVAAGQPGKVATFSVIGQPQVIRDFYEAQAVAAGMTVIGRVHAGELMSVDARRDGEGSPHTFSAMAVKKGQHTNVTLQFDVTL